MKLPPRSASPPVDLRPRSPRRRPHRRGHDRRQWCALVGLVRTRSSGRGRNRARRKSIAAPIWFRHQCCQRLHVADLTLPTPRCFHSSRATSPTYHRAASRSSPPSTPPIPMPSILDPHQRFSSAIATSTRASEGGEDLDALDGQVGCDVARDEVKTSRVRETLRSATWRRGSHCDDRWGRRFRLCAGRFRPRARAARSGPSPPVRTTAVDRARGQVGHVGRSPAGDQRAGTRTLGRQLHPAISE